MSYIIIHLMIYRYEFEHIWDATLHIFHRLNIQRLGTNREGWHRRTWSGTVEDSTIAEARPPSPLASTPSSPGTPAMGPSRRLSPSLDEGYRFASPPPSPVQGKGAKQLQGCPVLTGLFHVVEFQLIGSVLEWFVLRARTWWWKSFLFIISDT